MPLTQATRHRGRGSDLAEHAPLDDYHRHRGLVQRRIAGSAGVAHGDAAVAAIDGGAQRRADAYLGGDAGDDQRVYGARGQGLLKRGVRSEEHTSELQSLTNLVCRLLLEKKKKRTRYI